MDCPHRNKKLSLSAQEKACIKKFGACASPCPDNADADCTLISEPPVAKMKISDIGDDYNQALRDGSIAKTMKALFKLDKHHLFTPFKMGYYCAVLIGRKNKKAGGIR